MSCGNPFPEHRCTYKCAEKKIDTLQARVKELEEKERKKCLCEEKDKQCCYNRG